MKIDLSWSDFKVKVGIAKTRVRYVEREFFYHISLKDEVSTFETSVLKDDGSDQSDFESNYKAQANTVLPDTIDADGSRVVRSKAAKAGWTYQLTSPEFVTSTLSSLYHKDAAGDDLNHCLVKFFDSSNNELTDQGSCDTSCVKTVFSFEPPWDYEIIGGTIKTVDNVAQDVRVWVIGVPDIPEAYGGSKVMVQGVNLKFVDPNNGIETDGRAAKYMTYSATYHTNKLQVIVKHPAGNKTELMVAFELYKA
jgi:hypothetical protein